VYEHKTVDAGLFHSTPVTFCALLISLLRGSFHSRA
jgi:hypothetical protein